MWRKPARSRGLQVFHAAPGAPAATRNDHSACWGFTRAHGFTLVETLFVVSVIAVIMASSIIIILPGLRNSKAETALQTTLGQMRHVHEMAIDYRRHYRLSFITPRTIQVDLLNNDGTFTFVSSIALPQETQFIAVSGIPVGAGATPDGLGSGNAIDFDVDFGGGGTQIFFQPDGSALDSANRLNNGVVYIARPGDLFSSRAVSMWGAAGRLKGWHLVRNSDGTGSWYQ
jgi:prepilin-type N-terminal cleavage/methylation domain-containing protein